MNTPRSHLFVTLVLIFAALVFGMVLAGGSQLTTSGFSAQGPQRVAASSAPAVPPTFADLAEAVLPAVVTVRSTTIETGPRRRNPFEFFFGPRGNPEGDGEPTEYRSDGAGSGFVISSDGWIVTNHHVIEGASSVEVTLEERSYPAEVRGRDAATDLALLKVDIDRELPYLALGDSKRLRVGDWVMAVGSPLYLTRSITVGVVSAKGRSGLNISDRSFENFIQTDAAINRGNSGGPLVNLAGEVIGINTAMNFGAENIGFAVPVSTLKGVLDQLRSTGRVRRGYLGVEITNLDQDAAEAFGVDSTDGALIQEVRRGSPAQDAGLRNGDIIVSVDDKKVRNNRELIDYVAGQPPGTSVDVGVLRNGRAKKLVVELGEREPTDVAVIEESSEEGETEWLGIQYQDLSPGLRQAHGLPDDAEGVWVTDVTATSPLVDEGVAPGTLIAEVNGETVTGSKSFEALVSDVPSGRFLRLYVRRFGGRGQDRGEQGFFAIVRAP